MSFFEFLYAILFGIIEGLTEWLPVSSTGHLILLHEFLALSSNEAFLELFDVVIQLGAILAVAVIFRESLDPFAKTDDPFAKRIKLSLWGKIVIAVLPSAVIGLLLDDILDNYLYNPTVVSVMLVLYGIAFIVVERKNAKKSSQCVDDTISTKDALAIGAFQVLSLIPGTSRSGATILGGLLIGKSRSTASEFSFFLAIPTMLGASLLKALKFIFEGHHFTGGELGIIIVGGVTAFFVSILSVRYLMSYVKKHSFSAFGFYRIALGALLILYFSLRNVR